MAIMASILYTGNKPAAATVRYVSYLARGPKKSTDVFQMGSASVYKREIVAMGCPSVFLVTTYI